MKIYYDPSSQPAFVSRLASNFIAWTFAFVVVLVPGQNEAEENINNEIIQNYEASFSQSTILTLGAFNIRPSFFNNKESRWRRRRRRGRSIWQLTASRL